VSGHARGEHRPAGSGDDPPADSGARRCRPRPRPLAPGGPRPTDRLAAFFLVALAFLVAGGVVAVLDAAGAGGSHGRWLALHLALLGGVSQLVLGAGQFFATAFLATDPPSRALVRAQLASWSAGTLALAIGVPADAPALVDLGGLAILAGLALFAVALFGLERRSLQRAAWAVRWYHAAAASLALGALVGVALAHGSAWTHGSLLGAHLALNLAGWLGTAIVGTLHTFFPSLTHTRLPRPRLQGPTFAAWLGGVAALAAGAAFHAGAAVAAGWALLALAGGLLAVNLAGCARAAQPPLGLAVRLVGAGQAFLVAGLLVALAALVADGPWAPLAGAWRDALAALLLAGWVGLTVAGSLLHLLAVLRRVRHLGEPMPAPRPRAEAVTALLAVTAVAALAASRAPALDEVAPAAELLTVAVAALLAARILALAALAVRGARLRV
jgi:nitrite reductase (NO-forming)